MVYIGKVIEHGAEQIFLCGLSEKQTERCMDLPAWIFDRAACLRIRRADTPQVELAALICSNCCLLRWRIEHLQ
jgi:hypothetical protein